LKQRSEFLKKQFGISEQVCAIAENALEKALDSGAFAAVDEIKELNQYKVIKAFQDMKVSDSMFNGTSGYGYDDRGRDTLDKVFAQVFGAEAALVRQQIVSGTQAIAICMFGVLRPGMNLVSATGKPYDTLEEVIGIRQDDTQNTGSLKDFGVAFRQADLLADGSIDFEKLKSLIDADTGMVLIQRSRGYDWREALSIQAIKQACAQIKVLNKDTVILVDNCYGEFVETLEPTDVGGDLIAGSLIKNPGGGLALTGGYVAGRKKLVELAANRLTSPGLGAHVGPSLSQNRAFFQGLFMAPHVVAESIKGAIFCGLFMKSLGFEVSPEPGDFRGDIIQAVKFGAEEPMIAFCQGIQMGSPIDSFVEPQPWDMPGYEHQVIMAAGGFVQGASIELSADAPLKPPYIAYMQGGLVLEHVKLGLMMSVQKMLEKGLITL